MNKSYLVGAVRSFNQHLILIPVKGIDFLIVDIVSFEDIGMPFPDLGFAQKHCDLPPTFR